MNSLELGKSKISELVAEITSSKPCNLEKVIQESTPFKTGNESGVYLLLHNSSVVYVGQSTRPEWRIMHHANSGHFSKEFDSFHIIRCAKERLDDLEALLILYYTPILNGDPFQNRSKLLLSPLQAAKLLKRHNSSRRDLNKWIKQGLISPIGRYGQFEYFLADEVKQLIATKLCA